MRVAASSSSASRANATRSFARRDARVGRRIARVARAGEREDGGRLRSIDGWAGSERGATSPRRVVLGVPIAVLGLALVDAEGARAAGKQDRGCESCSDSNSALAEGDKRFVSTESGLRYIDLKVGDGAEATVGKRAVCDWVGYTAGYQAKKIESTRETDEPFVFTLGRGEAIPAFEEAVVGMRVGGVRRIEIPGELEEKLGYSRDKALRYNVGPKPTTFGGQRALDFVLDNQTLRDFNRTLLFDIRLSAIR